MQKSSFDKISISEFQTIPQMPFNGPFTIIAPQSPSSSTKFIESNRHRNWNQQQLQKFASFLHFHHEKMETIDTRKTNKIFKVMSQYIQTRNVNQCRIFATKMMRKFNTPQRLSLFFRETLSNYNQIILRQQQKLKNAINSSSEKDKNAGTISPQGDINQALPKENLNPLLLGKNSQQIKPTDTEYPTEESDVMPNNLSKFYLKESLMNKEKKINRKSDLLGVHTFTENGRSNRNATNKRYQTLNNWNDELCLVNKQEKPACKYTFD